MREPGPPYAGNAFVELCGGMQIFPVASREKGSVTYPPYALIKKSDAAPDSLLATERLHSSFSPHTLGAAALRLLHSADYGFPDQTASAIDIFKLPPLAPNVEYQRFFAIARNPKILEIDAKTELVEVPLIRVVAPMFALESQLAYPEVSLALGKAAQATSRWAVREWLVKGQNARQHTEVQEALLPWMRPVRSQKL